jgi:hypothetical protein
VDPLAVAGNVYPDVLDRYEVAYLIPKEHRCRVTNEREIVGRDPKLKNGRGSHSLTKLVFQLILRKSLNFGIKLRRSLGIGISVTFTGQ